MNLEVACPKINTKIIKRKHRDNTVKFIISFLTLKKNKLIIIGPIIVPPNPKFFGMINHDGINLFPSAIFLRVK